jgi:hypothetical protein
MCVYVSVCRPANHAWTTSNRTGLVCGQEGIRQATVAESRTERETGEKGGRKEMAVCPGVSP